MGVSGRSTMTLLSTLAALVIIVHTAEEEYERAQGYMRARSSGVDTSNYDKAWIALDMNPTIVRSRSRQVKESMNDGPKYRRSPRKRKHRPIIHTMDDLETNESPQITHYFINHPDLTSINEKGKNTDISENPGLTNRWGDEIKIERPNRRRGHRRKKQKNAEIRPKFSEFNGFGSDGNIAIKDDVEPIITKIENNENVEQGYDETYLSNTKTLMDENDSDSFKNNIKKSIDQNKNDKSMSEFSLETMQKHDIVTERNFLVREQVKIHPVPKVPKEKEKAFEKNNQPIDPLTLKAILKRSNGKSLSEILQQNNLSLSDLLQGKEEAVSKLTADRETNDHKQFHQEKATTDTHLDINIVIQSETEVQPEPKAIQQSDETENTRRYDNMEFITTTSISVTDYKDELGIKENNEEDKERFTTSMPEQNARDEGHAQTEDDTNVKTNTRRRYPFKPRRKIRRRPFTGNVYKSQLSRDLIALTSKKNTTTEWMELLPSNVKTRIYETSNRPKVINENCTSFDSIDSTATQEQQNPNKDDQFVLPTTDSTVDFTKTTIIDSLDSTSPDKNEIDTSNSTTTVNDYENSISTNPATEANTIIQTTSENPTSMNDYSSIRTTLSSYNLRRQALSNRLKNKRMKQKSSFVDSIPNTPLQDVFGNVNLIPASESIEHTRSSSDANNVYSLSQESTTTTDLRTKSGFNYYRSTKPSKIRSTTTRQPAFSVTEETAKHEIEEILNDTQTSARLSKILMERNMTLNELVQHRERGSSQVHLADIFHNASKEPNPPEPFLSKSFIEPISKETYPLRAILDANSHDPKTPYLEASILHENYLNNPVVMNYGNNVNENGENMGIISLFNNISPRKDLFDRKSLENTEIITNDDDLMSVHDEHRGGRNLKTDKDLVTWNDIFELVRRNRTQDEDHEVVQPRHLPNSEMLEKILLEEDSDGDGVIVLEDLQRLKDNNVASSSEENLEAKLLDNMESTPASNSSGYIRSVTVVTASIIGLGLVLFLLTYTAFKWRQQSKILENKICIKEERVPSPVFENRQGKQNSSTRSKSPMLSSNIYAIESLDPHNGTDSPEYMWDSLRKPFQ